MVSAARHSLILGREKIRWMEISCALFAWVSNFPRATHCSFFNLSPIVVSLIWVKNARNCFEWIYRLRANWRSILND
jgi:hypothetical protein